MRLIYALAYLERGHCSMAYGPHLDPVAARGPKLKEFCTTETKINVNMTS